MLKTLVSMLRELHKDYHHNEAAKLQKDHDLANAISFQRFLLRKFNILLT